MCFSHYKITAPKISHYILPESKKLKLDQFYSKTALNILFELSCWNCRSKPRNPVLCPVEQWLLLLAQQLSFCCICSRALNYQPSHSALPSLTSYRPGVHTCSHLSLRIRRHHIRSLNTLTAREPMGLSSRRWLLLLASHRMALTSNSKIRAESLDKSRSSQFLLGWTIVFFFSSSFAVFSTP